MALIKCKSCGGTTEIQEGQTVFECEYCGKRQTVPAISDDRKASLYDRANHFRRNNEFDKAESIFEQILREDPNDAESYWSLVLCKYGIQYVEDPSSHKMVPTVNRTQYESVFSNVNYQGAIEHADASQKEIYEEEAKEIDRIQKGILEISKNEEPFDVFICYKETDQTGKRTKDSVIAQELYYELTKNGFKVFFSRITLESKLGTAYEPYIFAALNSSKVMVVVGTKPEYFNAVWVKNEWSRYLALIKAGAKKVLIPAYRDMDPYDLPEDFALLQAQDMSKLGFMQDLVSGIKKLTDLQKTQLAQQPNQKFESGNEISNQSSKMFTRIVLFLEDYDFDSAQKYCERALDEDPTNPMLHIANMMSHDPWRLQTLEAVYSETRESLSENKYFQKALRFSNAEFETSVLSKLDQTEDKKWKMAQSLVENVEREECSVLEVKKTVSSLKAEFGPYISDRYDLASLISRCERRLEEIVERQRIGELQCLYDSGISFMQAGKYNKAKGVFSQIERRLKDSDTISEKIKEAQSLLLLKKRKKITRTILIISAIALIAFIGLIVYSQLTWETDKWEHKHPIFGKWEQHSFEVDSYIEPTCTENGTKNYYCTVCGWQYSELIPALGHSPDDGEVTKEPTCADKGVRTYCCTTCGTEISTELIPALGHSPDDGEVTKEPTCTDKGVRTHYCTVCGTELTSLIPTIKHHYEGGKLHFLR